jgi:hypothetical protein
MQYFLTGIAEHDAHALVGVQDLPCFGVMNQYCVVGSADEYGTGNCGIAGWLDPSDFGRFCIRHIKLLIINWNLCNDIPKFLSAQQILENLFKNLHRQLSENRSLKSLLCVFSWVKEHDALLWKK